MRRMPASEMKALVGQVVGTSEWVEVTQERINIDEEKAKLTPFGGTIAHGFLTLSLIPLLTAQSDCPRPADVKMGVNYGGNKTRFLAPVRSGKRVRGVFKLLELDEKRSGQWQQSMEITVEIEGEPKPALMCEWITQFFV